LADSSLGESVKGVVFFAKNIDTSMTILQINCLVPAREKAGADVTIVIATFNRANYLPEAIDSLLAQSESPRRIVVIDDGSTDNTASVVEKYKDQVEYLYKKNEGKAKAINYVLPSIDTEFVWFFDDDDVAYPYALKYLLAVLESNPELGFAFGAFDVGTSDFALLSSPVRSFPYRYAEYNFIWQRLYLFRSCTVMMTGSLLRTAAVRAVGGLNEVLIRGQDYDLMLRLACHFSFRFCERVVYIWREHKKTRGSSIESHAHNERIRIWAHYNEPIGHYLLNNVPLELFMPEGSVSTDIILPKIKRKTLIIRAWALATKLPASYPVMDLVAAFRIDNTTPLDNEEQRLLEHIFHHDFIIYRLPLPIQALLRLLYSKPGCVALGKLSRGLYWLGHEQDARTLKMKIQTIALFLYAAALFASFFHGVINAIAKPKIIAE